MLRALENLKQTNYVRVPNFLQDVHLLHYFLFGVYVLHVAFINCLDSDLAPRQFMNRESNLAEGAFTDQLHKFVEVLSRRWNLLVLLQVELIVPDKSLTFFHDRIVDTESILINDDVVNDLSCRALD